MFATKRFYLFLILGVLLMAGTWAVLVLGQFGAPTAAGGWITRVHATKGQAVRRADSPRLLILGGESAHFGISAETLGVTAGLPVLNLGTHHAFGLGYMLDRATPLLRRGDRVVLMLEYELFANPRAASSFQTDALLAEGWPLFDRYRDEPQEIARLVFGTSPERLISGYRALLEKPAVVEPYAIADISATGDALGTDPTERNEARWQARIQAPPTFPPASPIPPTVLHQLERFVAACRARGVAIAAAWPAIQRNSAFGSRAYERFFDSVARFYRQLGLPLLGDPYTFIRPPEDFLAGPYQVHAAARAQLTRAMEILLRQETDMLPVQIGQ